MLLTSQPGEDGDEQEEESEPCSTLRVLTELQITKRSSSALHPQNHSGLSALYKGDKGVLVSSSWACWASEGWVLEMEEHSLPNLSEGGGGGFLLTGQSLPAPRLHITQMLCA
ncbi:unnamed protein product [Pleuronectes platessa]|uniref:Uncharacterized protein n=1 Tax=Pleuronectes platessa TaxID=8262 RepID=A0A9N7YJ03_PLEPL|nr:unnamed protein product [Pleuronectes platessa]